MKELTPIGKLNQSVASTYRHAAGGILEWKQERAFFEAQIKGKWQIEKAVRNGIELTIESLKLAARECAAMGLSMSPQAQLVYFIPRKARKRYQSESKSDYDAVPYVVTATPSYRGLAYIAMNYAGAQDVAAEVVYAADKFRYLGPMRMPEHEPTLDNRQRQERDAIGVYCVVVMKTGTVRCEYVDAPTVQKIRQLSEYPNALMWTKLWTEGWRKVPIRRICKTVMITEHRMGAAVEAMNAHEGIVFEEDRQQIENNGHQQGMEGLRQAIAHTPDPEPEPDEPPARDRIALSDPVQSSHPPGSIEWWTDQINAAPDLARMDDIRAAALADMVDQGEDADLFRELYAARCKTIRGAA